MSKSQRLLSTSAVCQFEWRPSKTCTVFLYCLTSLACLSIGLSQLSAGIAWPAIALTIWLGLHTAWRYHRLPVMTMAVKTGGLSASVDDVPVQRLRLYWRGQWLFLHWQDARRNTHRCVFWPDGLTSTQRRELRLLVQQ